MHNVCENEDSSQKSLNGSSITRCYNDSQSLQPFVPGVPVWCMEAQQSWSAVPD
jgi:hypothetical protein